MSYSNGAQFDFSAWHTPSFGRAEFWTQGIFANCEDLRLIGRQAAFRYWHIRFQEWSVANHTFGERRDLRLRWCVPNHR